MVKSRYLFSTLLFLVINSSVALAKEFPVQARFFVGSTSADLQNVNNVIEPQGLKKFEGVTQLGLEITYPVLSHLEVGLRYGKKIASSDEKETDYSTDFSASIDQQAVLLLARVPFIKTDIFRVDAFAGFGGSNTTFKVKTAGQDGELSRAAEEGWFSTPYSAVGASAAIGYKKIYFVVEGGVETNKVDGFERTGSVSSNIDSLNLSGSYFMIGLMFDGIPGSFK